MLEAKDQGHRRNCQRRRQEWWHPGRDFVVAPFIGQTIGEGQKKKRSSLQNELVFGPKVCDDQKNKKKAFA